MNCVEQRPEDIAFEFESAHSFPLKLWRVAIFQGNRERLVRIALRLRSLGGENSRVREDLSTDKIFRRLQAGPSSDPAQKARSARTRWLSATAGAREIHLRIHQRIALRATDGDYRVARHAIAHTLHLVAATLRCRLRLSGELPAIATLPASQELRPA